LLKLCGYVLRSAAAEKPSTMIITSAFLLANNGNIIQIALFAILDEVFHTGSSVRA
jgi:hypothetical protein